MKLSTVLKTVLVVLMLGSVWLFAVALTIIHEGYSLVGVPLAIAGIYIFIMNCQHLRRSFND
jgi:hypothetical protein